MPGPCPGGSWHRGAACRAAVQRHYLAGLALASARDGDTAAERLSGTGPLLERLWEPLTVAVLNASVEEASARLLWPVVRLTFGQGEAACRAYLTRDGLGPNLVEPGVRYVEHGGGRLRYNRRLRAIEHDGRTVTGLDIAGTSGGDESFAPGDVAVLAVTPQVCTQLLPGIPAPLETRPIVNAHFRLDRPVPMPGGGAILGVVGGTAQWIFARGDIASVTVSAAGALAERPAAEIAETAVGRRFPGAGLPAAHHAGGSHREGEARDLRPDSVRPAAASAGRDPLSQPLPRRRLDRDRAARHHRGCGALRRHRGAARAACARHWLI